MNTTWWLSLGAVCAIGLAGCRSDDMPEPEPDAGGECAPSCLSAITKGGVPCIFDEPGSDDYKTFLMCCGGLPACSGVLDGGTVDGTCVMACEALAPPCSHAYQDCYAN